jgi:LysM repeat protein
MGRALMLALAILAVASTARAHPRRHRGGRRRHTWMVGPPERTEEVRARAERLELGGHVAVNALLTGTARADWTAEAGGDTPPTDLAWPLEGGQLARGFASGWHGNHRALDLMAPQGTPIHAAERGIVAYSAWGIRGYGGLVMLVHPGGWVTLYGHASALLVGAGQIVQRGERIALVGHSGNACGDHLHFELRRDGGRVDPAPLLVGLPPGVTVPPGPVVAEDQYIWKVRRGQTLPFIAHRAGVPVGRLRELNQLAPDAAVAIGQRLVVPDPPRPARATGRRGRHGPISAGPRRRRR